MRSTAVLFGNRAWSDNRSSLRDPGKPARPLLTLISGLVAFVGASWRNAALRPVGIVCVGEVDRPLASKEAFRGRRKLRGETELGGRDTLRPWEARPDTGERPEDGLPRFRPDFCRAKVFKRARAGFGAGRGFKYLSSGFMVLTSELVELTLTPRCIWWPLLKCMGTSNTLTACPGTMGQDVVDGSAGL